MPSVQLTFLGSGDAFGSGGRLQTCMLVEGGGVGFLIDRGTTALIAMRRFGVEFREYRAGRRKSLGALAVTPYRVRHPSAPPPFALRVECAGKVIAYTGDTEWTDGLVAAAEAAEDGKVVRL